MNKKLFIKITDPSEIVDQSKYNYYYKCKVMGIWGNLIKAEIYGDKIQESFGNKIGKGYNIKVYKVLINKKIIKKII